MDFAPIMPQVIPFLKPLAIPVAVIIIIALRAHREYRLRPGRLWIAPAIVTALIGTTLYLAPHPPFDTTAYAAMLLSAASGFYFGVWQANETVLRHDPVRGWIMARSSSVAVLVLAAAVFLRFSARRLLGENAALTSDMSLLFALGLILALRVVLWRRTRGLVPA